MREQELVELEQYVRALEQTNLGITEKLNAAFLADATTVKYWMKFWNNILIIFSFSFNRNTFLTELFPDDTAENITTNSLLAVDLGQLTIRSDNSDITFEQLLSKFIEFELQFLIVCFIA